MSKSTEEKLLEASTMALMIIDSIYQWSDMVDEAGGTTSISGIAKAHAMFESMKRNRPRVEKLVTAPLKEAMEEMKNKVRIT